MNLVGHDLTIGYSDRVVGRGLNVALAQGEVLALLGPNGGGKTTLLKTLLGLIRPLAGEAQIEGRSLAAYSIRERARRIAYVPQLHTPTFAFTVEAVVLIALRWRLNVMSLPEDEARALGLATGPFRIAIIAAATLVTSASVATSGVVGWVGLVVPHLARALVGPDFPRLVPTAALLGGGYLLFIDTIARTAAPVEIPLGILTAVIGTPFFIWLLAGMQRTWS